MMYSLRSVTARRACSSVCAPCLRYNAASQSRANSFLTRATPRRNLQRPRHSFSRILTARQYSDKSSADSLIEDIQEQYDTARDEFEIAAEETEKKSLYGHDDRAAAREELDKLKNMYEEALRGTDGGEVKRRIGQRIRELDNAVVALEERALEE